MQAEITPISTQISAVVVRSMIEDNRRVKRGDLLAQLDDRTYIIALHKATAPLAQRRTALTNAQETYAMQQSAIGAFSSDVNAASAMLAYARQHARLIGMLQQRHYVSQGDLNTANLHVAEAKYRQAAANLQTKRDRPRVIHNGISQCQASVAQAQTDVKQARLTLSETRIRAPADGVISNRSVRPGMTVHAGQAIASIVFNSAPRVSANFKETQKA